MESMDGDACLIFGMSTLSIDFLFFLFVLVHLGLSCLIECIKRKKNKEKKGKEKGPASWKKTDALDEWRCAACFLFICR